MISFEVLCLYEYADGDMRKVGPGELRTYKKIIKKDCAFNSSLFVNSLSILLDLMKAPKVSLK